MKWFLAVLFAGILVFSGHSIVALTNDLEAIEESILISEPVIEDTGQYVTVNLNEATSSILEPGNPMLPVITKVFTFPFGTKVKHVDVSFSESKELILPKEVMPVPEPIPMTGGLQVVREIIKKSTVYEWRELYPSSDYTYTISSGLDNDKHVVYFILQLYPVRYSAVKKTIYYREQADIKVTYEKPVNPNTFDDIYDLVIIAPSEYSDELQPLVDHKNSYGVETFIKTTDEIYGEYQGFDAAEEIKYFIKDAIEDFGVEYVLLIGSIDKLPIRISYCGWWGGQDVLCDLYYSDIYNETGFCSWDGNNNGIYGEVYHEHHNTYDIDGVDLYPDVHLGRLACMNSEEVNTVVDKIIYYETNTYGKSWFDNILLLGGDTFPDHDGNEGEELNLIIEGIMSDFTPTKLWTSTNTFNALAINQAINNGMGFVDYSGHGFAYGMGTHPPNSDKWKYYFYYNLGGLSNNYKLPIIFFDACLTARLDYDESDSRDRSSSTPRILNLLLNNDLIKPLWSILKSFLERYQSNPIYEPRAKLKPCFAWNWINKNGGGAIATIGATRTAFGGFEAGAGKMSIEFFSSYENSEYLGQMMTQGQNGYITDVPHDLYTVEEFILLGDPSLKIGGYP